MLEDLIGSYGSRFLIAALGVGLALVCFAVALLFIRRRAPSPFVRGGKNRQPRLQVLDAAAVDARRRLVLVRRDDVEHLIMIGGPTDIVIESGIGGVQDVPATQPQFTAYAPEPAAEPRADIRPAAAARTTHVAEAPPIPAAVAPATVAPAAERRTYVEPAADPERMEQPRPVAAPVPAAAPAPARPALGGTQQATAPAPSPAPARAEPAVPAAQEAEDALEAARQRVLPQQVARPVTPPVAAASAPKKELGSEFDRILEAEMANNLSAERIPMPGEPIAQPNPTVPPRDPKQPVITGAGPSEDPAQKEMARIFGEISVTREK